LALGGITSEAVKSCGRNIDKGRTNIAEATINDMCDQ
jgi:hypothetical protein